MMKNTDLHFMRQALVQAEAAGRCDEVPVGAVLVHEERVIACGSNRPIGSHDPTAHAEIVALREGARRLDNYRLLNCTLYVTLEPCIMCAGAIIHARVQRLMYGASDPKTGAAGSVFNIFASGKVNHVVAVEGGLLEEESAALLKAFFKARRG